MKKTTHPGLPVCSRGFTLIELMIALAIVAIVLVSLSSVFIRSNRLYTAENVKAALQGEMRGVMEIMSSEIRMAGYDPSKNADAELKNTSATRLHFTADLDEDGTIDSAPAFPDCEVISFRYSAPAKSVQLICGEGTGGQDVQTLIGGTDTDIDVTALNFDYRDGQRQSTTFIPDIRGVVITLTAEAPAGRNGVISRTYETWVEMRNAASNAAN